MIKLDIDQLRLAADGDEWQGLRKLDTEDLLELQLAKALLGIYEWLGEKMPMEIVMDIYYELDNALEQANIERTMVYQE